MLVTGGAGYVGVPLSSSLAAAGHKVTVVDCFRQGSEAAALLVGLQNLEVVARDVRDIDQQMVSGFDVIFHLAGISSYPACEANPTAAFSINEEGTRRMVKMLGQEQLLVYASTTAFYGAAGVVDESMALHVGSTSMYGMTKFRGEQACMERGNSISLRFATIFGVSPKMRHDLLVHDFVRRALHDRAIVLFQPDSMRSFVHLDDAIDAYHLAIEKRDLMVGKVFNVGAEELNLTKREVAEEIRRQTGCEIIVTDLSDPSERNFLIGYSKLAAVGFNARKTLSEGIEKLARLYRCLGLSSIVAMSSLVSMDNLESAGWEHRSEERTSRGMATPHG